MDKKVKIPKDVHVVTAKELAHMLQQFGDAPVFFATSNSSKPRCTLSVYSDAVKQVWIDIGSIDGD